MKKTRFSPFQIVGILKSSDQGTSLDEIIWEHGISRQTFYLWRQGAKDSEPMFISNSNRNHNERLTTRTISSTIKNALIGIGLNSKHYTAHSLRHTTAVSILRAGASIEHAQGVLRHRSTATTQIYTATIKEEQRLIHATELMLDNVF